MFFIYVYKKAGLRAAVLILPSLERLFLIVKRVGFSRGGHFPPSKPRRWTFGYKVTTFLKYMQQICAFFVKNLDIRQKMITFAA